jgi:hypothetical protein
VGTSQTLWVEGHRVAGGDGESFNIAYKWSSTPCTTSGHFQSTSITISSLAETTQSATLNYSSGRLCVLVADAASGSLDDTVAIDRVAVETGGQTCP